MPRNIHADALTAQDERVIREAYICRLEVEGDPLFVWTGLGPYTPSGTGDAKLEEGNPTYTGVAVLGSLSQISDSNQGSRAVKLTLSGVSLSEPAAKQIINEARNWQFRKGYLWGVNLDANDQVIGAPWRLRSGRMVQMEYLRGADDGEASITVDLAGYNAYAQEPLYSRYSEQKDLDAVDTSQDWVHELANLDPSTSDGPSNPYRGPGTGTGGNGGGRDPGGNGGGSNRMLF